MKLKAPTHTEMSTKFVSRRYHWLLDLHLHLFDPEDTQDCWGHIDHYKYIAEEFLPDKKAKEFNTLLQEIESNVLNSLQTQVTLFNAESNKKPTRKVSDKVSRRKKIT